jgi:hypothetical protein
VQYEPLTSGWVSDDDSNEQRFFKRLLDHIKMDKHGLLRLPWIYCETVPPDLLCRNCQGERKKRRN